MAITTAAIGAVFVTDSARREALIQRGNADLARSRLDNALNLTLDLNRQTFQDLASSFLAETPGGERLRIHLGRAALRTADQLHQINPKNPQISRSLMEINWTLGRIFGEAHQPRWSVTHFDLASKYGRGVLTLVPFSQGDYGKLCRHDFARHCLDFATTYRERGRHAEAFRLLDEALGHDEIGDWLKMFESSRKPGMKYVENMDNPYKTEKRVKLERARIDLAEARYAEALGRLDEVVAFFRSVVGETAPERQVPPRELR
jgi:tetratricopeptide (TPR) repeat protein